MVKVAIQASCAWLYQRSREPVQYIKDLDARQK